jgi:hypothetical protein
MNFNIQYKQFIENEVRVSKALVEPMNIYRISSYVKSDGKIESKSGTNSDLIFLIGTHPTPQSDKKLNCLKISEIHPDKFIKWLGRLVDKRTKIDEVLQLSDMLIKSDNTGKLIFERYIKPSPIVYNLKESIYRTYNLNGIRYIQQVQLNRKIIEKLLK